MSDFQPLDDGPAAASTPVAQDPLAPLYEAIDVYRGAYLASYVVRTPAGFQAYTKICAARPRSVWETTEAVWKVASQPSPSAVQALDESRFLAQLRIDALEDSAYAGL